MEKEIIRYEKNNLPLSIMHLQMASGIRYRGMHFHAAIEIVAVKSGVLYCYINEEKLSVYPDQLLLINSNRGHRLSAENAKITYYHISTRLWEEDWYDTHLSKLTAFISHTRAMPYLILENCGELEALLHKIDLKYGQASTESRLYIKAYLYELYAFMYTRKFISPFFVSSDQHGKIEKAVQYIDTHYQTPLTLDEICDKAKYTKFTLCHTFKAVTGASVFDYVHYLRGLDAVEKLNDSDRSILEIANECGFSSATYFNRVFKKLFGTSPSVYKKLLRENNLR